MRLPFYKNLNGVVAVYIAVALLSIYSVKAQAPVSNFTATPLAGCSPLVVNFQDLSTGNPTSWAWDFGNGGTSALKNPTATYFNPGTYTVQLTVTNASGSNTLTRTQYITVYEPPSVDFKASNNSGCFPLRVQFDDLSTPGAGNTNTTWLWDFGNGTQSTQQNPFVTYANAGNYTVILKVTNDKGCTKLISKPNFIQVTSGVAAGFSNTPVTVCHAPATISFTNTSAGPAVLSYLWNFGDGNTSTQQDPVHTYAADGSYTVTLTATSSAGCFDMVQKTNLIVVGGSTTSFDGPATVCRDAVVNFQNTSSPAPISSVWDFGDGTSSSAINPAKTYTAAGTFTVKLINNYGYCQDSAFKTIIINPRPAADFTAPVTSRCQPPLTVQFQDASGGAPVSWQWDFGDGNTSTQQNPTHTYTNYGVYNVSLRITNSFGCVDSIRKNSFIGIAKPVIAIPSLPTRGCIPFTINPTANITTYDAVTSYLWDFGDGATSTSSNPSHTYPAQGSYTVKLLITTSTGCTDSLVIPGAVTVGSIPTPAFSATPIPVCAFQPVQFSDLSTPANEWLWDFGDGTTSILQNPSHTYEDTGFYTITLDVTNNGCRRTIQKTNYVRVLPPIARFTSGADCADRQTFSFIDQSIGATGWLWDFGDGNTSTIQNPFHTFPGLGTYTVKLTVTNGSCSHAVMHTVQVLNEDPDFTAAVTKACKPVNIGFTIQKITAGAVANFFWDFGDGSQVNTAAIDITHAYTTSGTFTVVLITTDINGCRDTVTKTNYIRINGPVANFTASNTSGCKGLTTTFNDLSTSDGVNNITTWTWDFGDGVIKDFTAPPFQHTYSTAGTFSVKLKLTDASGCVDSITAPNLIITTSPVAAFSSADTLSCPLAPVNFTNASTAINFQSSWSFGDGNTSTVSSPSHAYSSPGSYTIKLNIVDQYGCPDSVIKNQYIKINKPVAAFTVSDSISSCLPFEVVFTNTSQYYTSSSWDFGGIGNSQLTNPTHYFGTPGTYIVRLVIVSPGGCIDSAKKTIQVFDTAGSRLSYSPLNGCTPLNVNLNAFSPGPVTYLWDFGDGNTADTPSPDISHTYASFGNYVPKIIMKDPSGCLIPVSGADTIRVSGAVPKFGADKGFFCDSGLVRFTDSTTFNDPIVNYSWDFGDGSNSSLQHPVHSYLSQGLYTVSLTASTQSGCTYTLQKQNLIKIVQSPLIDIGGDTSVCIFSPLLQSGIFQRPDTSAVKWQWTFPNGNTAAIQNPLSQTYTAAGNFAVTAIATNTSGCADTVRQNIIVHPLPVVNMPGTLTMQAGFPVTIPAVYSPNTATYSWAPSTGLSCINCPQPIASPKGNTRYIVSFTDSNSCRNSGAIEIIVICKNANVFVPNTFSPNGDGSNDVFYPRGVGIDRIKTLRIFNRWGEIVFEARDFPVNNPIYGWNGIYKGKKSQPDVYIYQVEVFCDNGEIIHFEGNVALIL